MEPHLNKYFLEPTKWPTEPIKGYVGHLGVS
jgi:hypothetical protein